MAVESREVRRLILCSRREHVRRAAFLVEDGLRTATLAGSGQGLVIVRSLTLGCIDPRDPPAALSRRIEEKWNQAERIAVPAVRAEAPHASAVRFESKEQAFAIYMTERLAGGKPHAWYWERVLPRGTADLSIGELFAALALALAEPAQGAAARVAAFIEHIEKRGALLALAEAVDERHAAAVLSALLPGVRLESVTGSVFTERIQPAPIPPVTAQAGTDSQPELHGENPVAAPYRAVLRSLERGLSGRPAAAVFAAAAIMRERPWLAGTPEALARAVRAVVAQVEAEEEAAHGERVHAAADGGPVTAHTSELDQAPERGVGAERPHRHSAARRSVTDESAAPEQRRANPDEPEQPTAAAEAAESGELSYCAGLFFLLPVIERLGFDEFVAEHPLLFEAGLLPALLYEFARVAGAMQGDPILAALGYAPPEDPAPEFAAAIADWRRRVQRYVRREAKLLVRWVVRRRGYIHFTRTHIRVYFDLDQADVRLRRLGLDIDPGWVPALGKVISYSYGRDES